MPSFFIAKCKCGPVVAPFVGFPFESLYGLLEKPYTFLGPTWAINSPFLHIDFDKLKS